MAAEWVLGALVRANFAASAAIVLTLALRPVLSRMFGARAVYRLWLLVPIIVLAAFIPAPEFMKRAVNVVPVVAAERSPTSDGEFLAEAVSAVTQSAVGAATTWANRPHSNAWIAAYGATTLLTLWLAGAVLLFVRAILRSQGAAADPQFGPALVGTLRPKLILPSDFATRFDVHEQRLILAHENIHRTSGHAFINALVETWRCANWVNPLAHVAAFRTGADQELSCDAAVIAQFPDERRVYAQALLKAQAVHAFAPLGCAWPGHSSNLLRARIEMLARPSPGRSRSRSGLVIVAALVAGCGYATWSVRAADIHEIAPPAAQGHAAQVPAEPPAGLLTDLEKRRHARNVNTAEAGNIDIVFIGDSDVDFWRYDNTGTPEWNNHSGGKAEWDRSFAPLRAVNFGVEGAHARSVLWRLQNGELQGMKPKVVVLSALGIADAASHGIEVSQIVDGNRAIVAEIRKRQPQARILLVALPRGQPANLSRQVMNRVNAELARLADNRQIYIIDLYDRFLAPDGTLDSTLYADALGQVLSPQGYAAWALALKPKIAELVQR